jgi:hypothetical protein
MRVFDRMNGKPRPGTPDGEAFARDFYLIDSREAPKAVQELLGQLEGIGAEAIRQVTTADALPTTDEGLRSLLAFVALQPTRTQRVRQLLANFYNDVHLRVLDALADAPAAYAKAAREEKPDITDAEVANDHSQLRKLVQAPGLRVEMDQTTLIKHILNAAIEIEDALCVRQWELCVAPAGRQFITSDDPVVLQFYPGITRSFVRSPGFGRRDTVVSFVLGPRHVIFGHSFEPKTRRTTRWPCGTRCAGSTSAGTSSTSSARTTNSGPALARCCADPIAKIVTLDQHHTRGTSVPPTSPARRSPTSPAIPNCARCSPSS